MRRIEVYDNWFAVAWWNKPAQSVSVVVYYNDWKPPSVELDAFPTVALIRGVGGTTFLHFDIDTEPVPAFFFYPG